MRPPIDAAVSDAPNCRGTRSGAAASTVSTFQLIGRFAVADISENNSISSSLNMSRQPSMIASSVVPGYWPVTSHNASNSSFVDQRDGTGLPSPSECVDDNVVENPSPPASSDSASSACISLSCSADASFPTDSLPMT
jgi:hypothetical protein